LRIPRAAWTLPAPLVRSIVDPLVDSPSARPSARRIRALGMLFSSTLFLFLFLPCVLLGQGLLHPRLRNIWLLLTSLVFYGWGEPFVVAVMLVSVLANWLLGLWIGRSPRARLPLLACLVFNLGLLVVFKYADWLVGATSDVLVALGALQAGLPRISAVVPSDWTLHGLLFSAQGSVRLPIGISFFTFQAMSYLIDVRRGAVAAQKNPIDLALYISLFPQLIAGPIVRYSDIQEQIGRRTIDVAGIALGIRRFVLGLGKKMLIANPLAEIADAVFAIPGESLPTSVAWLGIACYTAQIYFDFSGYSDMAIGLGRMLGFRFLENFSHPYVARSITEFWRRWHISLSTWFRDYLYIPLGGNRASSGRTLLNLVIVFALCGLWHGASFSFLVWGLYHGLFLVIERVRLRSWLERHNVVLRHAYVLLTVMVGWVFFRAETLSKALAYLATMFGLGGAGSERYHLALYLNPLVVTALCAAVVGSTPLVARTMESISTRANAGETALTIGARTVGLIAIFAILLVSCLMMAAGTYNPFIYFRF